MRRGWFVLLFWRLLNPVMRPLAGVAPWWVLVKTVGRKTGKRRRTPLAVGRRDTTGMWVVAVHGLGWVEAKTVVHGWNLDDVASMSAYARSGPRLTADNPLLVQFQPAASFA